MANKEVSIHIKLETAIAEDLRAESEATGAPVSEIVRRAIARRATGIRESRIVGAPAPVLIAGRETR